MKPKTLSFAAATRASHQVPKFPGLLVRAPIKVDNEELVRFSEVGVSQMAAAFTWSIIGKFSTGRPAMMDILNTLKRAVPFTEEIFPVAIDQRHILIRFSNREDFVKAYIKEAWIINGRRMRVFRWSPNFTPGTESTCAPVWVGMPTLRAHLQDPGAIQSIARLLGKYLCMHSDVSRFTRPGYTYICVEMGLSKTLKKTITIDNGGEIIKQVVDYGKSVPPFCHHCSMIGHLPTACQRSQSADQKVDQDPKVQESNPPQKVEKLLEGNSKSAKRRAKRKVSFRVASKKE